MSAVVKKTLKATYWISLALGWYLLWFQVYPDRKFVPQFEVCLGVCVVIWCIIQFDFRRSNKSQSLGEKH